MTTKRLANRIEFASRAAAHGRKGGSVSSDRKKEATSLSLVKARYSRMKKMAEEGRLFKCVVLRDGEYCSYWETLFVGGKGASQKFARDSGLSPATVVQADAEDLEKFAPKAG